MSHNEVPQNNDPLLSTEFPTSFTDGSPLGSNLIPRLKTSEAVGIPGIESALYQRLGSASPGTTMPLGIEEVSTIPITASWAEMQMGAVSSHGGDRSAPAVDALSGISNAEPLIGSAVEGLTVPRQVNADRPSLQGSDQAGGALTWEIVEQFRQVAIAQWSRLGIDAAAIETLQQAQIQVQDLGDSRVGLKSGTTITLDDDAAGAGWFIDATPWDDVEFSDRFSERELRAVGGDRAFGKVDLLTVLTHEMGHILGMAHPDSAHSIDGLMNAEIPVGIRRLPDRDDLNLTHQPMGSALTEALRLVATNANIHSPNVGNQKTSEYTSQSVGTAPNGNYVVTWSSEGQDGSGWGVYA
jgi:hypothetical protein